MGMGRLVVWVREVSLLNACEQDQGQGEPAPTLVPFIFLNEAQKILELNSETLIELKHGIFVY
jgi:hypothetical protein